MDILHERCIYVSLYVAINYDLSKKFREVIRYEYSKEKSCECLFTTSYENAYL